MCSWLVLPHCFKCMWWDHFNKMSWDLDSSWARVTWSIWVFWYCSLLLQRRALGHLLCWFNPVTCKHVIRLPFLLTACFCLFPDHSSLDYLPCTTGNYDFRTVQAISKVRCRVCGWGIGWVTPCECKFPIVVDLMESQSWCKGSSSPLKFSPDCHSAHRVPT